jgi:hypothetical protein
MVILHCWGELVVFVLDLEDAIFGVLQETLYEEVLEAIDGSKTKKFFCFFFHFVDWTSLFGECCKLGL